MVGDGNPIKTRRRLLSSPLVLGRPSSLIGLTGWVGRRVGLTPFLETSGGGGGAREGRRRGPDASPPPPRRIAVRCPPGLEQQHHADLCLGCKPGRPQRAEEGSALLRERQHRAPSWERRQPWPGQRPVAAAGSRGSPERARAGSVRRFAQAAGGGAARAMAGDSEQTLQNHQQPNGGEPFLIGVSGGTASGKVQRGPGAALSPPPFRSPPGSRPLGGACGRRPRAVSVAAATAWPARLRSWQRSSAETSLRGLRAPLRGTGGWGLGPPEVPEVPRLPIAGLARSPGGSDSWPGSCGGGAEKTDAYCFASPTWGRGL